MHRGQTNSVSGLDRDDFGIRTTQQTAIEAICPGMVRADNRLITVALTLNEFMRAMRADVIEG